MSLRKALTLSLAAIHTFMKAQQSLNDLYASNITKLNSQMELMEARYEAQLQERQKQWNS